MINKRAFSLIELLVVVSIVAIISVIAIAQYQEYSVKAKISQAMVIFNNIGNKAQNYYESNGAFPNLQQIGLYYDPLDPTQSPMAEDLSDYIANYIPYTFLADQGSTYTCPSAAYGGYISNLKPGDIVTTSQTGSVISINYLLVYVNNTVEKYCQYFYMQYDPQTTNITAVSGNIIPGCTNGNDDPNSGDYFSDAGNQC